MCIVTTLTILSAKQLKCAKICDLSKNVDDNFAKYYVYACLQQEAQRATMVRALECLTLEWYI